MTDAFGEPLEVGDYVGYVSANDGIRTGTSFKGRVVDIKKKIKVVVTDISGFSRTRIGEEKWLYPHRTTRTLHSFARIDRDKERQRRIDEDPHYPWTDPYTGEKRD